MGHTMRQSSSQLRSNLLENETKLCVWEYAARVRAQMPLFIIGLAVLPKPPQDFQPAIGYFAVGFILGVTVRAHPLVIARRPGGVPGGESGPALHNLAQFMVTGIAKGHQTALATLLGDRAGACQRLESRMGGKALAVIAQHGQ